MFISFEGVDGSGKSTQARLLADHLRAAGQTVLLTREPGGSAGAEEIRRLLVQGGADRWSPETELLLFNAARRDHVERAIRPALARGDWVISDRFADSSRVYQGAARADLRTLVDELHALVIGIEPDLTLVIDIDPAEGLARAARRAPARSASAQVAAQTAPTALSAAGAALPPADALPLSDGAEDRFESLGLAFQQRLRDGFLSLAAEYPQRVRLIDGTGTTSEVAARVADLVDAHRGPQTT